MPWPYASSAGIGLQNCEIRSSLNRGVRKLASRGGECNNVLYKRAAHTSELHTCQEPLVRSESDD